jgi:hypothetical protein
MRRVYKPLILAAGLIVGVWWALPQAPRAGAQPGGAAPPADALQYRGTASCASMACHNMEGPPGAKGSEYTTFFARDKHAKAYEVLFDRRSLDIEKNLRQLKDVKDSHPEKDALCLSCHAVDLGGSKPPEDFSFAFGIGCETCHGPAGKWLTLHYEAGWQGLSAQEKESLGFYNTKNLSVRADQCIRCHVGSLGNDVSHELYGAGHPRLNFELGAYHATMPKHWSQDERVRYPDLQARLWAIGQLKSAQGALELLASRAEGGTSRYGIDRPWPEFAEYDCYACHHDLSTPSPRQRPEHYKGRIPGSLPLNTWYYTMPLALSNDLPGKGGEAFAKNLKDIRGMMSQPDPEHRKEVAKRAREAAKQLGDWVGEIERGSFSAGTVRGLLDKIVQQGPQIAGANWDQAAQVYLAIAALYQSMGDLSPGSHRPALTASIRALVPQLEFPKGVQSPTNRFDPRKFSRQLEDIHTQLGR